MTNNQQDMSLPGFSYSVNEEELVRYMALRPEEKLRWLRRARLTLLELPPHVQELHRRFSDRFAGLTGLVLPETDPVLNGSRLDLDESVDLAIE